MRLLKPLLLATALGTLHTSFAMQLGASKSTIVFGRILDLSIPIRFDSDQEDAVSCFSADVFQADNRFDIDKVRIDILPSSNSLNAILRLRSVTPITEPWAKVILRSNCGAKISRQYDFLTDFASEPTTSSTLADNVSLPSTTATASKVTTTVTSTTKMAAQAAASNLDVDQNQAKAQTQKPNITASQVPKVAVKKISSPLQIATAIGKPAGMPSTALAGQSRFKMETFALTDERQVLLKLSSALVAPTAMRTPEEAKALAQASAVWRAMNDLPPEIKASPAAVAVENQPKPPVANMSTAVTPASSAPKLVNQTLANKSDFSNPLIYGLIGLLAVALSCIAWLWMRARKTARTSSYDWLSKDETDDSPEGHDRTQFLPTMFHEPEYSAEELAESTIQPDLAPILEPTIEVQTKSVSVEKNLEAALTHEARKEAVQQPVNTINFDAAITEDIAPEYINLEDIVLEKAPLKLLPTSPTETTKEDTKSNMIDFDIFADVMVPDKSTKQGIDL